MSYVYIAGPYSSTDAQVQAWRYKRHRRALWTLLEQGRHAVSPVVIGHDFEHPLPRHSRKPHDFWMRYSYSLLAPASSMVVLTLPGWEDSKGLALEVDFAVKMGKPIVGWSIDSETEGGEHDIAGFDIIGHFGHRLHRG